MTHYDDIEEFKGGGRISPSISATTPPKGTLGIGVNGDVWINAEDKNGRLSWKPTDIKKANFRFIDFYERSENSFSFSTFNNGFNFSLEYKYDTDFSIIKLKQNVDNEGEWNADLNGCNAWFEDNFSVREYNLQTSTDDGIIFQSEVRQLFGMLRYLITNKGLRSITAPKPDEAPEPKFKVGDKVTIPPYPDEYQIVKEGIFDKALNNYLYNVKKILGGSVYEQYETALELSKPETPEPKFKRGDKVKLPNTKNGQKLVGGMSNVYDDAKRNGQDYLVVTEVWDNTIMLDTELSAYGDYFSQELDKLELYDDEKSKWKVGDKVKFPKDKAGVEISSIVIEDAKSDGKNYLVIGRIDKDKLTLVSENSAYDLVQYDSGQIELYEEVPEPSKKFWRKLSIENGNIFITSKKSDEKYLNLLWLQTAQNVNVVPVFADEYKFVFQNTYRTKYLYGVTIAITLDYVKGISLLINTTEGDFFEIKRNDIVNLNKFREAYEEFLYLINQYTNSNTAQETNIFVSKLLVDIDARNIAFGWKENTLKVGDKVVIPLTKMGQDLKRYMSTAWDNAIERNQKFMYVTKVLENGNVALNDVDLKDGDGDYFNENLDNLIVYNKMPETPKTPFQQIDFLNPSAEEYSKLITGMINYSDGLKFNNSRSGVFKIINKDGSETEFSFIFNEVDNTISITPIGRDDLITVSKKIKNENIEEIAKIYWDTFTRITKIGLKIPPKDCEADPNKIISGQVKKFYDLNKTRIDKLDSKFSCKIVQALVSLSEYESCGSPSSVTLPKAKSDLLSRISNLKV
jgi:hypothetical protein